MEDKEFVKVLSKAMQGDSKSIIKIINEYNNLILKYSKVNGIIDEDCVSTIKLEILKAIPKFKNL